MGNQLFMLVNLFWILKKFGIVGIAKACHKEEDNEGKDKGEESKEEYDSL